MAEVINSLGWTSRRFRPDARGPSYGVPNGILEGGRADGCGRIIAARGGVAQLSQVTFSPTASWPYGLDAVSLGPRPRETEPAFMSFVAACR
jgi:hypothetical protein